MTDVDLFLLGGQSNMVGDGSETQSPDPPAGTSWYYTDANGGTLTQTDDPVQNVRSAEDGTQWDASSGSLIPQFAVTYTNQCSRNTVFVQSAVGGTEQVASISADAQHWDDGGDLYSESVAFLNDCETYLNNNSYNPTFKGVIWLQGESDGAAINDGTITKADYKSAFENMISKYRAEYGSGMPFWIIEVGDRSSESYVEVQEAQREVALAQDNTYLISDKQKLYPERGYMINDVHYNQTGYNLTGEVAALNVAEAEYGILRKLKRGTTSQNDSYTGEAGEPTVVTDTDRIRTHDGSAQGGTRTVANMGDLLQ